ncbi:NAD(P)-dependent dehydrogenase, short-chain alcohol dehydrogenase family [Marinilactibacillus piezotolerans]|uniref:NAD(P)-dependent dehydrogenase, short-chain alcohol dehydrogenase family n=1 Tax=Marinilactibacillus piezotolerans TaxID=258723 RepID=A0A1I4BMF5_9LACT|nr:SDR family oxidoreductase [Marinilactibacillus piezotolerans]SFK69367.1 NAD(P)-dependent dehydrogenase, short-chain alcohol dehydrogenase family [Marinilactibacillus piezotolerans]
MDLGIKEKIALITGSDSGIGKATAKQLLAEGATVILTDIEEDKLAETAEKLQQEGKVYSYPADIRNTESLKKLHQQIKDNVGKIDILVQNAGTSGAQGEFHEIEDDGWVETLEVDLLGPVRVTREFLSDLRSGGWGRIVYLSSENAVQPYADELPYDAAKAGVLSFSKGLSRAYAKEGLLVNTVSPAFIETPMTDEMMEKRSKEMDVSFDKAVETFLDEKRPHIELKRRGQAEEVAAVISFLCSDKASFVNGANYRVDGGSVATIQ